MNDVDFRWIWVNFLGCHRFDLGLKEKDVPVFYHCRRVDYLYRSRTPLSIGLAYAFDNASPPCSEIKKKVFFMLLSEGYYYRDLIGFVCH